MKIKDLFELNREFRKFEYICGQKGEDNVIANIEITEVPDGVYWVSEGDFLITTGYFIKKDEIAFENFIKMLIDRKASGLGIKVGRFIDKIPMDIINIAEANDFPIISVPLQMPYRNIIWPVINKLIDNESYDTYVLKRYIAELKKTIKNNYNINAITELISLYLNYKNGIFWGNNFKQINSGEDNSYDAMACILKNDYNRLFVSPKANCMIVKEEGNYYFFKIEAVNYIVAYLCIFTEKNELNATDLKIVESTLPYLSVYLLSNPDMNLKYYKNVDEFFLSLIQGDYSDNEMKLKEDSAYLDIAYSMNRIIWTVNFSFSSIHETKRLVKTIKSFLNAYQLDSFCLEKNKRLIFVSSINSNQLSEKLYSCIFKEMIKSIEYSHKDINFSIGVSKICSNLKYLSFAHDEAVYANKIGNKIHPEDKVYYYDNYMVYHLLYEVSNHPTLSKIYKNTVERIIKYDNKYHADLFETVLSLIKNDFNINQTSNHLFIHRNTLYKRIAKINNLLDLDIDKSENRLILQIAFKLKEILD
jgi:PucR family transcriptional regulator, purine catabolism regulatory protein